MRPATSAARPLARARVLSLCAGLLASGCALPSEDEASDAPDPLPIERGVPVRGAGPDQRWQGIVNVQAQHQASGGVASCTATFISERHLISAAHCFVGGRQRMEVRAPSWDGGAWHRFENATAHRASEDNRIDIAVVDLGAPVAWATPERRFALHAGTPRPVDLFLYGYGMISTTNPAIPAALHAPPGRVPSRVDRWDDAWLLARAAVANVCHGDSGGPAIHEGSAPVIWGIISSSTTTLGTSLLGTASSLLCAEPKMRLRYGNVSGNLAFVERVLARPCARTRLDDQDVARCD